MKKVIYLLSFIMFAACSTVVEKNNQIDYEALSNTLENFEIDATLSISLNSSSNSANAKIRVAKTDSISLLLNGPFGITLGNLYSDEKKFKFTNVMTNQVLTGKPSAENLKAAIQLYLEYNDFIKLIRAELPGNRENYIFDRKLSDTEKLFKNTNSKKFVEYAVISDKKLTQYQRKALNGDLILHVFYSKHEQKDKIVYPIEHLYKFPMLNASLSLDVNNLNIIENFDRPFDFSFPEGIDIIDLDKQ